MELNEIKEKIKNFDFKFLKYLNQETKELSNKVILFSSILIFLNLNFLSVQEFEITGIKILVEKNILGILILLINTYYFLQFRNSSKIDSLISVLPNDFTEITDELITRVDKNTKEMNKLEAEARKRLDEKNFDQNYINDIEKKGETLKNDEAVVLLNNWRDLTNKGYKYHKRNILLNQLFPKFCYVISILSFGVLLYYNYKTM